MREIHTKKWSVGWCVECGVLHVTMSGAIDDEASAALSKDLCCSCPTFLGMLIDYRDATISACKIDPSINLRHPIALVVRSNVALKFVQVAANAIALGHPRKVFTETQAAVAWLQKHFPLKELHFRGVARPLALTAAQVEAYSALLRRLHTRALPPEHSPAR